MQKEEENKQLSKLVEEEKARKEEGIANMAANVASICTWSAGGASWRLTSVIGRFTWDAHYTKKLY